MSAQLVDDSFDARHSSSGKLYRYQIWNGNIRSPLHCRNHWHVGFPLDLEKDARRCGSSRRTLSTRAFVPPIVSAKPPSAP
ncbi:MAG: hypothetical protein U0787_06695 [Polyangia bacterium]